MHSFLSNPSAQTFLLLAVLLMFGAAGHEVIDRWNDEGRAGAFRAVKRIVLLYMTAIALLAWFLASLTLLGAGWQALLFFFGTVLPVTIIWLVKRRRR